VAKYCLITFRYNSKKVYCNYYSYAVNKSANGASIKYVRPEGGGVGESIRKRREVGVGAKAYLSFGEWADYYLKLIKVNFSFVTLNRTTYL